MLFVYFFKIRLIHTSNTAPATLENIRVSLYTIRTYTLFVSSISLCLSLSLFNHASLPLTRIFSSSGARARLSVIYDFPPEHACCTTPRHRRSACARTRKRYKVLYFWFPRSEKKTTTDYNVITNS